jgi:hypothetical protein
MRELPNATEECSDFPFECVFMHTELSRLVDIAASISTSGRWAAVNAEVERLAADPGVGNAWYVEMLGSLCFQVCSEYLLLKRAYEEKAEGDSSLLAWRARNLLELSVWSIYSANNRDNARRLYEDAGRDALGVFDAFIKWGTASAQGADWLRPLEHAKDDLAQRATLNRIDSLDGPYKQVSEAAKECGIGSQYSLRFKMLSKFTHPTAMRILASADEAKNTLQRDCFFSHGCLYFIGAFKALESQLIDRVQEHSPSAYRRSRSAAFSARLKACPDTNLSLAEIFDEEAFFPDREGVTLIRASRLSLPAN